MLNECFLYFFLRTHEIFWFDFSNVLFLEKFLLFSLNEFLTEKLFHFTIVSTGDSLALASEEESQKNEDEMF